MTPATSEETLSPPAEQSFVCKGFALKNFGLALQLLGLAVIIGGMLAIGAIAAPVVFAAMPKAAAGSLLTGVFRRFDVVLLVSVALVLVGEWLTSRLRWQGFSVFRAAVLLVLVGLVSFVSLSLNPKLEAMQPTIHQNLAHMKMFVATHRQSETCYKLALLLAVIALMSTPFCNAGYKRPSS